jgi:hypothetical protein
MGTPVGRGRGAALTPRGLLTPGTVGGKDDEGRDDVTGRPKPVDTTRDGDPMAAFLATFTDLMKTRLTTELSSGSPSSPASGTRQPNTSTAKVQAPKNYQISQNFRIWLERFDIYATLSKIPNTERREQLLSRLDHQAYVAVNNLHLASSLSYEQFCAELTKRFHNNTRKDYKLRLRSRIQNSSETFESFSDTLQELALNAYPNGGVELQAEMALDQFLIGVKAAEAVKQQLLMSSPTSLGEAIRKVRQLEAAQLVLKQGASASVEARQDTRSKSKVASATLKDDDKSSGSSDMAKVLELLTRMNARITSLEQQGSQQPPGGARSSGGSCRRCGGQAHPVRNCSQAECFTCHKKGHISKDCSESGNAKEGLARGSPVPRKQ